MQTTGEILQKNRCHLQEEFEYWSDWQKRMKDEGEKMDTEEPIIDQYTQYPVELNLQSHYKIIHAYLVPLRAEE